MKKDLERNQMCAGCFIYITQTRWGRTRRYCSDACKMSAYRRRKQSRERYEIAADREQITILPADSHPGRQTNWTIEIEQPLFPLDQEDL